MCYKRSRIGQEARLSPFFSAKTQVAAAADAHAACCPGILFLEGLKTAESHFSSTTCAKDFTVKNYMLVFHNFIALILRLLYKQNLSALGGLYHMDKGCWLFLYQRQGTVRYAILAKIYQRQSPRFSRHYWSSKSSKNS